MTILSYDASCIAAAEAFLRHSKDPNHEYYLISLENYLVKFNAACEFVLNFPNVMSAGFSMADLHGGYPHRVKLKDVERIINLWVFS
jgi:hypothetical protein